MHTSFIPQKRTEDNKITMHTLTMLHYADICFRLIYQSTICYQWGFKIFGAYSGDRASTFKMRLETFLFVKKYSTYSVIECFTHYVFTHQSLILMLLY